MVFYSIDRWLVPLPLEATNTQSKCCDKLPHQFTAPYLRNNYVFLGFLTIFIVINLGLFISRLIQYRSTNGFVMLARACGIIIINTLFLLL